MAEAELLAELELVVWLVLVLVHILQEVRSQGRREWMRKIGVDHNNVGLTGKVAKWAVQKQKSHHRISEQTMMDIYVISQ